MEETRCLKQTTSITSTTPILFFLLFFLYTVSHLSPFFQQDNPPFFHTISLFPSLLPLLATDQESADWIRFLKGKKVLCCSLPYSLLIDFSRRSTFRSANAVQPSLSFQLIVNNKIPLSVLPLTLSAQSVVFTLNFTSFKIHHAFFVYPIIRAFYSASINAGQNDALLHSLLSFHY